MGRHGAAHERPAIPADPRGSQTAPSPAWWLRCAAQQHHLGGDRRQPAGIVPDLTSAVAQRAAGATGMHGGEQPLRARVFEGNARSDRDWAREGRVRRRASGSALAAWCRLSAESPADRSVHRAAAEPDSETSARCAPGPAPNHCPPRLPLRQTAVEVARRTATARAPGHRERIDRRATSGRDRGARCPAAQPPRARARTALTRGRVGHTRGQAGRASMRQRRHGATPDSHPAAGRRALATEMRIGRRR